MPARKNEELARKIKLRAAAIEKIRAAGDPSAAHLVAQEFGISYSMACYYLRGGNKSGGKDFRRTYTPLELANLSLMSPSDIKGYAEHTGRSARAVYAALGRHRALMDDYVEAMHKPVQNITLKDIAEKGYFDVSNAAHLKLMDRTREQVAEAKQVLAKPYHLSLRAPNILYHKPTNRRYYMTTEEQKILLYNPKFFLRSKKDAIREGWVTGDVDPIADEALKDVSDAMTPQHYSPLARRSTIKSITAQAKHLLEYKDPGLQQGMESYEVIVKLRDWADRLIAGATPEFSPSDPGTFTDLTTPKRPQSMPARQEKVVEDKSTFEGATTDEELLKILDDNTKSPTDEDAWMKDFKPASAQYEEVEEE